MEFLSQLSYNKLVMFLQEFDSSINSNNLQKAKKAKKEYSAGFKNYHPQKYLNHQQSTTTTAAESDLFDQLKIGNLRQLYNKSLPIADNRKQIIQAQQKSIQRLLLKPEKKKEQPKEQEDNHTHEQSKPKFSEVYHKTSDYQSIANTKLFKSQFKRVQDILKEKYQQNCKGNDFINSVFKFIINQNSVTSGQFVTNTQLIIDYTNFLNHQLKNEDKNKAKTIQKSQLQRAISKNLYLYGKFKVSHYKNQDISLQNVQQLIRPDNQMDQISKDQHMIRLLNKKYTIPYESQLFKQTKSSIIDQIGKKVQDSHEQKFIFTANSVPKTTYEQPKQRPQSSQKAKTLVEPFHLTDTVKDKKTMDDYYNWNRNFHAQKVPKTTYEAYQIYKLDQKQKKERIKTLLQSAAYPENMKYLQNYKKFIEEKEKDLQQKYAKKHNALTTSEEMPNFQHLHRHQIIQLENRIVQNRLLTTPQPFNLSQPKPKKQRQEIQKNEHIVIQKQQKIVNQKKSESKFVPQSTLKYQAYVNFRKKDKQVKQQKKQQQKAQQQKRNTQKNVYKEILKQRIGHQLHNIPKTHIVPQPLSNNILKVDLQKIYNVEPLLIQRQNKKVKKQQAQSKKSWDPII